jgi:hypothetical protein
MVQLPLSGQITALDSCDFRENSPMKFRPSLLLLTLIFVMGVILFYGCGLLPDSEVGTFLLNTEFFFDPLEAHGRVVGTLIDIPSEAAYRAEAKAIATLINRYQADIVGLTEVENRDCVELVRSYLWKGRTAGSFQKGS